MALLTGPHWLNDDVISFFFGYLSNTMFPSGNLLFVQPILTQLIKAGSEDAAYYLAPMQAETRDLIFFALNDNMGPAAGGNHWSLVVYSRNELSFFSWDSIGRSNYTSAKVLAKRLRSTLPCQEDFFIEKICRQQQNSYDCGVLVLANAEFIAQHFDLHGSIADVPILPLEVANSKRNDLLQIVRTCQSLSATSEPESKKQRSFLMLSELHGSIAAPSSSAETPADALKSAAKDFKKKIATAPRVTSDKRAFGMSSDLILEGLIMKVNLRMYPDAINAGNLLTEEMFKPRYERNTEPDALYKETLVVSSTSQLCRLLINFFLRCAVHLAARLSCWFHRSNRAVTWKIC